MHSTSPGNSGIHSYSLVVDKELSPVCETIHLSICSALFPSTAQLLTICMDLAQMEMDNNVNTLHQLEEELDTNIYPGTEVMTDVGSRHFVKSSGTSSRVLVPQPSSDPCDPLNWSPKWKVAAIGCTTFMVPIQSSFGRRPVLIISTLICLVSNIWRAVAKDYGSFMGACILNGIGAGPAETKWHRVPPNKVVDVQASTSDKKEITQNIEDADESQSIAMAEANPTRTAERDPYLHRGSPSKKQFRLWQNSAHPFRSILTDLWIPWKLFAFPIVEFSSFVVSWSASSFLTLNLTQSQNFAAPPYNFSSQSIGFMNLATFVGSMIGLLTNGPLSDWIADRATKNNKGIREPEMRLPALIPYVLIMLVGNFVVAFGCQYKWDWRVR
ncbi:hypothetical protein EIK77_005461 [Talaromyces pinophilus]|nr:hypothetical protein EIK77_005461 [Talaromyces pinophilus]